MLVIPLLLFMLIVIIIAITIAFTCICIFLPCGSCSGVRADGGGVFWTWH